MNDQETTEAPKSVDGALAGVKVYLIEDDRFLHKLLGDKLAQTKAIIVPFYSGEDALVQVEKDQPNIILMDILLPGMNGFEVLSKLKANPAVKDIPVIIISNLGQESDVQKGMDLGAEEFLIKANFTLDEIMSKVEKILAAHKK